MQCLPFAKPVKDVHLLITTAHCGRHNFKQRRNGVREGSAEYIESNFGCLHCSPVDLSRLCDAGRGWHGVRHGAPAGPTPPRACTVIWVSGGVAKEKDKSCRRDVGAGKGTSALSPIPAAAWAATSLGWGIGYPGGTNPCSTKKAGGGRDRCTLNLGPDRSGKDTAGKILILGRWWFCHQGSVSIWPFFSP